MKGSDFEDAGNRYVDTFDALIVFGLCCAYLGLLPFCFDVYDEGLLADTAERLYRGELLYRDIFSYWNPGGFWLCEALYRIAGVSVQTLRVSLVVFGAAAAVGVWRLARDHAGRVAAILAALAVPLVCYPMWWMASTHWYTTFVSIGTIVALRSCIDTRHRPIPVLVTGALCGTTFVFLQAAGAFLCVAVGGVIAWDSVWIESKATAIRRVGLLALGALIPIVAMYGYFAAKGAFPAMLNDTILWILTSFRGSMAAAYGESNVFLPNDLAFEGARFGLMAIPPIVIASALVLTSSKYFQRSASRDDRRLFALALSSAGVLGGNYYYPDVVHLAFAAPPSFALIAALGPRLPQAYGVRPLAHVLASGLFVFALFSGASALERMRTDCRTPLSTPRGAITANSIIAEHFKATLSFVDAQMAPKEPFYVYPYGPGYYFLTGHVNATPLEGVAPHIPGFNSDEQLKSIISALESKSVRYVLVSFLFGRGYLERHDTVLERYIRRHYHIANERPFILERDSPGRSGAKVEYVRKPR